MALKAAGRATRRRADVARQAGRRVGAWRAGRSGVQRCGEPMTGAQSRTAGGCGAQGMRMLAAHGNTRACGMQRRQKNGVRRLPC